ncbi:MAG: hypothetical protein HFJ06_03215 [Lachnospiraceae bacterium]|nr:hypothetical protein [Lachnospiraceae bacterium]
MDLIFTDKNRIEQGVLHDFYMDFDTTDKKDFQLSVGLKNRILEPKGYWYINNTEYGGKIDHEKIITETKEIQYTGRNYRGILCDKVIEPPPGHDHKIVSGNLQTVIQTLINDAGLTGLYKAEKSSIGLSEHKFNRYITLYDGIMDLGYRYSLVPRFKVVNGICCISFSECIDYSDSNEYSQDDLNFTISKSYADVNHLICLGKGELKDRTVLHLYTDKNGNISNTQSLFGEDEVTGIYENTNAEDITALKNEGIKKLEEMKSRDSFEVTIPDTELQIGDIIGGIEVETSTYVARPISNIIAKLSDDKVDMEYKVGEDNTSSSGSGSNSSSSLGGGTYNLPPATGNSLGGVKIGEGIQVEPDGNISVPDIKEIKKELVQVFTSVSSGKNEIAAAITDKRVITAADDTFSTMADNIRRISTGVSFNAFTIDAGFVPYTLL